MIVSYDKSFSKALDRIKDSKVLSRIENSIRKAEIADGVGRIPNTKKLIGYSNYYRIKVGDYRIGFELVNFTEIRMITVLHRKDIYKKFP